MCTRQNQIQRPRLVQRLSMTRSRVCKYHYRRYPTELNILVLQLQHRLGFLVISGKWPFERVNPLLRRKTSEPVCCLSYAAGSNPLFAICRRIYRSSTRAGPVRATKTLRPSWQSITDSISPSHRKVVATGTRLHRLQTPLLAHPVAEDSQSESRYRAEFIPSHINAS